MPEKSSRSLLFLEVYYHAVCRPPCVPLFVAKRWINKPRSDDDKAASVCDAASRKPVSPGQPECDGVRETPHHKAKVKTETGSRKNTRSCQELLYE